MLLERSEQLAVLSGELASVAETGAGRLVLVAGEAGIGKTSVVRVFCAELSGVLQRVSGASGTDVGFVLVNNSSMPANITATLRDANGSLLNSRVLQLGPTNQIAYYVPTFFSLGPELLETNYTNLLFESDVPLAAIALASGGTAPFVTVPISRFP